MAAVHAPELEAAHDGADAPLLGHGERGHQQRLRVVAEHQLALPLAAAQLVPALELQTIHQFLQSRRAFSLLKMPTSAFTFKDTIKTLC